MHHKPASLISMIKSYIFSNKMEIFFLIFCVTVSLLFTLNSRLFILTYGLLDPSYNYAVNAAGAQKLAFGSNFISTYGPLGFLIANYLPAQLLYANLWLLFHALTIAMGTFIFSLQYIERKSMRWLAALAILYSLNICSRGGFIEWAYISGYILLCFVYLKLSNTYKPYLILFLTFLAIIFSLTKFTLGFGAVMALLLLVTFGSNSSTKFRFRALLFAVFGYFVGLLLLSRYLGIADLRAYMKTAVIISRNFSSAMSFYDTQTATATFAAIFSIGGLLLWILWRERQNALSYAFILPSIYALWKYCVVRQDSHMLAIMSLVIPMAILYYFVVRKRKTVDSVILLLIITTSFFAVWANKVPFYDYGGFASTVTTPINRVINRDFINFIDIDGEKKEWAASSSLHLQGAALSTSMRNRIGVNGVDIFPWETVVIAANDLNWKNRPMPFSFNTYDPYLDNANATFIDSSQAPKYIVWHNTGIRSIDFRNLLWDEPKTMQSIMKNYIVVEHDEKFMLLERREQPLKTEATAIKFSVEGDWITIPNKNEQLFILSFELKQNAGNKLEELLLRDPPHFITTVDQAGQVDKYRFVKENTQQGFIVNNLPSSWDEMIELIQNHKVRDSSSKMINIRGLSQSNIKLKGLTFTEYRP